MNSWRNAVTSCTSGAAAALGGLLLLVTLSAAAQAVEVYRIGIVSKTGEQLVIGRLELEQMQDGSHYRIVWDDDRFDSHFLSMRPFKCLPHPVQLVCHLPYPYPINRVLQEGDLTDLEYDMLFLHKSPQEYGINAWNGLYFKFSRSDNGFVGELHETDLNVLQAPPEAGDMRPIDANELYEPSDKHWMRRVLIEAVGEEQQ